MTAAARRGVLAVLLAFVTLGTLNLLTVPSYAPRDESSHVAYALAVAEGRLPRVDDINPAGALPGLQPLRTWTANHPPLFYALVAAPLEIGRRTDHPLAGLRVARAINLGLAAIGVLLAGTVGALLLPRLPEAPILAAAATGLAGSVANTTAVVYNDGLGLAVSTALLVVGLRLLRDGPTRGRLALLTALAGIGALSRFTVVLAIAAASVLAAAAVWHAVRRRRVVATIGALVVPWIAAAAAAGWFYARNRNLYGSITGTDFIVRMTNRPPHPSFERLLGIHWFWRHLYSDVWGAFVREGSLARWPRPVAEVPMTLILVGVAVAAVRWWRRGRPSPAAVDAIAWGVCGAFAFASVAQIVVFYTSGGNAHIRYLYGALPIFGALSTIAYRQLAARYRTPITALAIVGAVVLDLYLWHRFCNRFAEGDDTGPLGIAGAAVLVVAVTVVVRALYDVPVAGEPEAAEVAEPPAALA